MIIAYTGLPGSGKSLSAIPDFILPALSKGRSVFSNIYGLDPMAIAARLGMNTPDVSRLLRRFSMSFREDVSSRLFTSVRELGDGSRVYSRADGFSMPFPDDDAARRHVFAGRLDDGSTHYSNAEGLSFFIESVCASEGDPLVVFDECHEYFNPRNFAQLEPFLKYLSEARHDSHDVLLITQHVRDIWEPLLNRVHQTDTFERGRLGMRTQYIHRIFAGSNILRDPVSTRSRLNDKSLYRLYSSYRKKGAEEHIGYGASIFRSRKFVLMSAALVLCVFYSLFGFLTKGLFGDVGKPPELAAPIEAPAPEHASNAVYVKYVVCGAFDCKATRPDGTLLTLPLDYASGKYPIEVKKYAPVSSSVFAPPSLPVPGPK